MNLADMKINQDNIEDKITLLLEKLLYQTELY